MALQNKTKYHELYQFLNKLEETYYIADISNMKELVKNLYKEYNEFISEKDDEGKYGIRYKTIHDDSSYSDVYEQFFISKEKRDKIYDDWMNDLYYDNIMEIHLPYPTPSPNVHSIEKIFKNDEKIYNEQL